MTPSKINNSPLKTSLLMKNMLENACVVQLLWHNITLWSFSCFCLDEKKHAFWKLPSTLMKNWKKKSLLRLVGDLRFFQVLKLIGTFETNKKFDPLSFVLSTKHQKMISTWASPVVTHPSTDHAWPCLISLIWRETMNQGNMADHATGVALSYLSLADHSWDIFTFPWHFWVFKATGPGHVHSSNSNLYC